MPERVVEAQEVPDAAAEPDTRGEAAAVEDPPGASHDGSDWVAAGVIFAILGGCCAMFLTDLSPIIGALGAGLSGIVGILFGGGE